MAKPFRSWRVLEHGELTRLDDNLWHVDGALPDVPHLRRHMTVARRSDGRLVLHNAIALDEPSMAKLESFGAPSVILVPNAWHRLDAAPYTARYPEAKVYCPRGARKRVEQVVATDGDYEAFPSADDVRVAHLEGCAEREGYMEVTSGGRSTLVFNDLVFNLPHLPGLFGLIYRALGSSGGPKVSGLVRMLVVKDRAALAQNLLRLAGAPNLGRVIPGHGDLVDREAPAFLRQVAATL